MACSKFDPGVDYWANLLLAGVSDNTVQASILSSPEFINGHGSSPNGVVQGYYVDLTGRFADPGGLTAWSNLLLAGASPFNVAYAFLASPEVSATLVSLWFLQDLGRPQTLAQLKADPGLDSLAADIGGS